MSQNITANLPHSRPPVIGIMGGIASGKSLVSDWFRAQGAVVLDADKTGHEVLKQPEVEAAARERWGNGIFGPDGHIHRKSLAAIVFAPTEQGRSELKYLEQLTHPKIGESLQTQLAELSSSSAPPAVILDAPVLLKAGWDQFCDRIVFVDAPRHLRLARASTRGWSESEFDRREASQESIDEKRQRAHWTIDNSGSPEATAHQLQHLWTEFIIPSD